MVVERLRIRDMTADDVDAVAVIRTRGRQAAYAGLMPQAYLDGLDPAEDAEQRRALFAAAPPEVVDLVAERDGGLVGWAAFGPARGQDGGPRRPPGGELYALFLADGAEDTYEVDGTPVTEVRYRRPLTRLPG